MSGRPNSFAVTTDDKKLNLDSAGTARALFTVTNTSAQTLRGRLLTRQSDPAKPEWFSIVGESVRDFAPNDAEQVVVQLNVPPDSPPGSYSFRLDAVSEIDPDEDFTEGPPVAFDIAAPPPPKKFPWLILAIVGAVVLLIIIGVVVFLLVRDGGSEATVVSSGSGTIRGTWTWDAETGQEGVAAPADVWWQQQTEVLRQMTPRNTATLVNVGVVDFEPIDAEQLSKLNYTTTPINGNADATNQLVTGDVFAVRTTEGNFAKVKVLSYGYNLGIQWVTYRIGG